MASTIVFTLRVETDHFDTYTHEELYAHLRDLLEDEFVNGSLADESNPVFDLELTYHME